MTVACPRYYRLERELLDIPRVCELLGISRWQVYELFNSRRLKSVYIHRRRLVARQDLDDFIQRLREAGES